MRASSMLLLACIIFDYYFSPHSIYVRYNLLGSTLFFRWFANKRFLPTRLDSIDPFLLSPTQTGFRLYPSVHKTEACWLTGGRQKPFVWKCGMTDGQQEHDFIHEWVTKIQVSRCLKTYLVFIWNEVKTWPLRQLLYIIFEYRACQTQYSTDWRL